MRILSSCGKAIATCSALLQELEAHGFALVRHGTLEALELLVRDVAIPYRHPHESRPGVTIIRPAEAASVVTNYQGFTQAGLLVHTDRSCAERPPAILATILQYSAGSGGEALIKDGVELVTRLRAVGFSWEDLATVRLQGCHPEAPMFSKEDGRVRIRYRDDDIAKPVCGDPILLEAIRTELTRVRVWQMTAGDGYIVHNHRFLHGRKPFDGDREVVRLLLDVEPKSEFHRLNGGFDRSALDAGNR